jgi:ATP-dependent RNA helicase DeaD
MPARILSIAQRHLKNAARITIAGEKLAAGKLPRIRQVAYIVARPHKPAALERVLETENPASALVFCRTRLEVDTLVEMLNAHGHGAEALHGGMEQRLRDRVMARFRDGTAQLLVATDVAARGLDVDAVTHVINFDPPADAVAYTHRVGRTGRAGRSGTGVTFVLPDEREDITRLADAAELGTELDLAGLRQHKTAPSRNGGRRGGAPRRRRPAAA